MAALSQIGCLLFLTAVFFPDPELAPTRRLLVTIEFSLDDRDEEKQAHTSIDYSIFDDGDANSVRHVYNWAIQAGQYSPKLSAAELRDMTKLVKGLPKEKKAIPKSFLVRVTHYAPNGAERWEFHRHAMPVAMKAVLDRCGGIRGEIKDAKFIANDEK